MNRARGVVSFVWQGLDLPVLGVLIAGTALFVGGLGAAWLADIPVSILLRDPIVTLDGDPYVGIFSQVGCLMWAAAAAVALVTWLVLRETRRGRLAGWMALISFWMAVDDMFIIHETLEGYGVESKAVLGAMGLAVAAALWTSRDAILTDRRGGVLLLALGLLAISVLLDEAPIEVIPGRILVEDGSKFLGILTWLTFTVRSGVDHLRPATRDDAIVPAQA